MIPTNLLPWWPIKEVYIAHNNSGDSRKKKKKKELVYAPNYVYRSSI